MKKRLLFLLPLLVLCSCNNDKEAIDGYEIEYKEATVDGVTGLLVKSVSNDDVKEVVIPKNVDGFDLEVKFIDNNVFNNFYDLTKVTLPDSLIGIYDGSFKNCISLETINLSNVTTIGSGAFSGCKKLKEVNLSENLNIIDDKVFSNCESLETINLNNNIETISDYAFDSCKSLKNVTLPNSLINIGSGAFKDCESLNNLSLPATLKSIGDYAFYGNKSLDTIVLPESLETLGYKSFYNCYNLFNVTNNASINSSIYDKSGIKEYIHKNIITLDDYMFTSNYGIYSLIKYTGSDENITLPDYINEKTYTINQYAFYKSNVKSITVPNTVTKISNYAFYDSKLDYINFSADD
nr:leucine-rich repeat domain-containing protein [Acholeplasmatales bacterium]